MSTANGSSQLATGAGPDGLAVRVRGLWKRFGMQVAVAGIDLDVPAGRFCGLVGPNGAGKTSALSMITGLLRPDAGTIEVIGRPTWPDPAAVKAEIVVLPEGLRLFERLSGLELLGYIGRLRRLPGAFQLQRARAPLLSQARPERRRHTGEPRPERRARRAKPRDRKTGAA